MKTEKKLEYPLNITKDFDIEMDHLDKEVWSDDMPKYYVEKNLFLK